MTTKRRTHKDERRSDEAQQTFRQFAWNLAGTLANKPAEQRPVKR